MGTTDPDRQVIKRAEQVLTKNVRLESEIKSQLTIEKNSEGSEIVSFVPNISRIHNVVIKNARGHMFFEHGLPALGHPSHIAVVPLVNLPPEARQAFETIDYGLGWPEVGSRLMTRLLTGKDMRQDGWVIVQPNIYRFAAMDNGQFVVRTVINEYLATEVIWTY